MLGAYTNGNPFSVDLVAAVGGSPIWLMFTESLRLTGNEAIDLRR